MTINQFYQDICNLPEKQKNRDLEEYLLALYGLVLEYRERETSLESFMLILSKAFISQSVAFDAAWSSITEAPDEKRFKSKTSEFEFLIAVLKFQIADLHKMQGNKLENELRYFGIDSETGNRWYNFDPFTNLECGVSCFMNGFKDTNIEITVTWRTLGEILENGRIYE